MHFEILKIKRYFIFEAKNIIQITEISCFIKEAFIEFKFSFPFDTFLLKISKDEQKFV
jgi:hypothetical protein